jgi:hypothetical protein
MKRWFRPVAWSIILVLLALALFGGERPESSSAVAVVAPVRRPPRSAPVAPARAEALPGRSAISAALFEADTVVEAAPAPAVAVAPASPAAVVSDLKVLGWMQSGGETLVFVEYAGQTYTLSPQQVAAGAYRFERIGAGQASFTFLPTGEARQYAVSDPAVLE